MPIRAKGYDTQILMPPFQMALPEGALLENIRNRFSKLMDLGNDIQLLKLVGSNTIGRLRFIDPAAKKSTSPNESHSLKELLTYPETQDLFNTLLEELAPRSGVSGMQPKVLWSEQGKKITMLSNQYILKSAGKDYPGLAVNEFFCLKATKASGLSTPGFHLADSGELLIVERFDFDKDSNALAFEEICALLHLANHGKYNSSYEAVAELIRQAPCDPSTHSLRDFFKAIVLSTIIGNGDAHLKNFGILYDDIERKWLAPIYDQVTTTLYIPKDVPALSMAGKKQWPDKATLVHFGLQSCGMRKKEVKESFADVIAGVKKIKTELKKYAKEHKKYHPLCERLSKIWNNGCDRVQAGPL